MTPPLVVILIFARKCYVFEQCPLRCAPDHSKPGRVLVVLEVIIEETWATNGEKLDVGIKLKGVFFCKIFHNIIHVCVFFIRSIRVCLLNINYIYDLQLSNIQQ